MLNRILTIILAILSWGVVVLYGLSAHRLYERCVPAILCDSVIVNVEDSIERNFMSPSVVTKLIAEQGFKTIGVHRDSIDLNGIESFLRNILYVKDVEVYANMRGVLKVDISQRKPIMRFKSGSGYDFYLSDDGWILPVSGDYVEYVPLVTGDVRYPFNSDYRGSLDEALNDIDVLHQKKLSENRVFLYKLINFVTFISQDDFWNSQIVQIQVVGSSDNAEQTIELVPRVGSHILLLGGLDNYQAKMDKMKNCYLYGMDTTLWGKFRYLDLQYADQIVGRNRR